MIIVLVGFYDGTWKKSGKSETLLLQKLLGLVLNLALEPSALIYLQRSVSVDLIVSLLDIYSHKVAISESTVLFPLQIAPQYY